MFYTGLQKLIKLHNWWKETPEAFLERKFLQTINSEFLTETK